MNPGWSRVLLAEILQGRSETPDPTAVALGEIRIVSKISFDTGQIELRIGGQTKTGMILIRPGDLVVSGINAAKGAIAIYGAANPGPIAATIHYGAYAPRADRVDVQFLWWLLRSRTFRELLLEHLPGGIKTELKAKRLLPIPIPLPRLAEQLRIVARIERLLRAVGEAKLLTSEAAASVRRLEVAQRDQAYRGASLRFGCRPLNELCLSITDGDHQGPTFTDEGVRFIFVGNVSSGHLHFLGSRFVAPGYFSRLSSTRTPVRGDVLYSAVGATLGIPAIVDVDEPFCFQRHIALIRPDQQVLEPRFLWHMLLSGTLHSLAWEATTGTAQPTVPLRAIKSLPVPAAPVEEQHRIVAHLDALQAKVDALKSLQEKTAAELDALLPSILDKAFRGEL